MKKLLLLFTLCLLTSCNNTAIQKVASSLSPEAKIVEVEVNNPAGYLSTADGKSDAYDGNPSNLELWDQYMDAHNSKNLDVIREMNADSTQQFGGFKVYDALGYVVDGADSHIERLRGWFEAENPQWNTFFSYTMKVDGQVGEWVISGHALTTTVDGEEKTVYDLADAYIEDGKIGAFWIYSRAAVASAE
jgi:G3E family GTPase